MLHILNTLDKFAQNVCTCWHSQNRWRVFSGTRPQKSHKVEVTNENLNNSLFVLTIPIRYLQLKSLSLLSSVVSNVNLYIGSHSMSLLFNRCSQLCCCFISGFLLFIWLSYKYFFALLELKNLSTLLFIKFVFVFELFSACLISFGKLFINVRYFKYYQIYIPSF